MLTVSNVYMFVIHGCKNLVIVIIFGNILKFSHVEFQTKM